MTLEVQPALRPAPRSVHSTTPSPLVDMSERPDRARPVDGPGRRALHESILFHAYRVPVRIEACACGGAVVAYEDVAAAVRDHQASPEHRDWRGEREAR